MKKITLLFIGIIISSCTSKTIIKKPDDLIPKDTMVLLLTDLFIASSASLEKNLNNERKVDYSPFIYNKYKIDSTRFLSSNYYYTTKFEEYDLIYKEVEKKLEEEKKKLQEKTTNKEKE